MRECPYCHKDIPQDSVYCYHCGKAVDEVIVKEKEVSKLKKNSRKNSWSKLGILLFFVGLIVFDFIIGTTISAIHGNIKLPYYMSLIIYVGSMVCGILSLYIDSQDKKRGYEPNGNKNYAYISIFLSLFIGLINLSQVILK